MKSPIEFNVKSSADARRSACHIVAVFEGRKLSPAAVALDRKSGGKLRGVVQRGDVEGKVGQTLLLHDVDGVATDRVLLAGCGPEREWDAAKFRKVTAAVTLRLGETGAADAVNHLPSLTVDGRDAYWKVRQSVEVVRDGVYRFDQLKSKTNGRKPPLKRMTLIVADAREVQAGQRGVREGVAIANGIDLAKELGNLPPNICTPTYLATQAKELSRRYRSITTTVLDRAQMQTLGMNTLLAVARGSREPPKLIVMAYKGRRATGKPIALVGKGVTFDSGGISIKPSAAMDEMKFDMCGGASVFGIMRAVAELELPLHLIGVVPATENMPGGGATKPADIVTSLSGQTVEILNTDAEGRLILCDAITYVERKFAPRTVIDIATLTGACVVALGNQASGLFTNHQPLADALLEAGNDTGDRAWQMPLWEEYQSQLDSPFADMANIGGREGGAITAACFLSRFARKLHWAHLDIAGTAWRCGKQKGSTGRPIPLLMQYLLGCAKKGR